MVIERVSGRPYREYLQKEVLDRAGIPGLSACAAPADPRRARPYLSVRNRLIPADPPVDYALAAGSVCGSVQGLAGARAGGVSVFLNGGLPSIFGRASSPGRARGGPLSIPLLSRAGRPAPSRSGETDPPPIGRIRLVSLRRLVPSRSRWIRTRERAADRAARNRRDWPEAGSCTDGALPPYLTAGR